jgi:hypothetical protein
MARRQIDVGDVTQLGESADPGMALRTALLICSDGNDLQTTVFGTASRASFVSVAASSTASQIASTWSASVIVRTVGVSRLETGQRHRCDVVPVGA